MIGVARRTEPARGPAPAAAPKLSALKLSAADATGLRSMGRLTSWWAGCPAYGSAPDPDWVCFALLRMYQHHDAAPAQRTLANVARIVFAREARVNINTAYYIQQYDNTYSSSAFSIFIIIIDYHMVTATPVCRAWRWRPPNIPTHTLLCRYDVGSRTSQAGQKIKIELRSRVY